MSSRRLLVALMTAIAALAAAVTSAAAATGIHVTKAQGSEFPTRTLILSLPKGQRIQPSQVAVTENGQSVVDLSVAPAGAGGHRTGTVLVIDTSDSMAGASLRGAFDAARTFAVRRNVNQQLAVVTFDNTTHVVTVFTRDQGKITAALTRVPATHYGTHLFDAVAQAITLIRAAGVRVGSIVLLTDGGDTGSNIPFDTLTSAAKTSNIRVFTVAFRSRTFHPATLQRLASETGGSFSSAGSAAQLSQIYDKLGLELAHEYVVSYHSIEKPGKPVRVKVAVPGVGSTTSHYRTPALSLPQPASPAATARYWTSPYTMLLVGLLIPLLLGMTLFLTTRRRGTSVRTRVSDYVSIPSTRTEADALVSRVFGGTERSLERTRWWTRYKESVEFSEIPLTPTQLVFATIVATGFAIWILWVIAGFWLALCGFLVPVAIRALVRGRMARKRQLFADQLADNLDVLASGLRAGHSLVGALAVVANDAPEPSKSEFQRVIADEQLGVSLENALAGVATRMKSRDMDQVVLVASVQGEAGGNMAEVLDRVTESIRERQEVRRLVRVLTAQGRLARWIVSALPVCLLIGIAWLNEAYMKPLFTHTLGQVALVIAALMIIAGSVVIGRIVDIEV